MKSETFILPAAAGCLLAVAARADIDLTLAGDRLTLEARNVPLREVLTRFVHLGVTVRADPELAGTVDVRFRSRPMDEAFSALLGGHGYVLVWDAVPGPPGKLPRLREIQVYKAGRKSRVRELDNSPPSPPAPAAVETNAPIRVPDEILLRLKPAAGIPDFLRLLESVGGTVVEGVPRFGVYLVRFAPDTDLDAVLDRLEGQAAVETAEPNYIHPAPQPLLAMEGDPAAAAFRFRLPARTGDVVVAVLDTGVNRDGDLRPLLVAALDATRPGTPISDSHGHGTHMALIATGLVQPFGAATAPPDAGVPVIPVRCFDDQGRATSFQLLQSLDFALAGGARVISLSWGSEIQSAFLESALARTAAAGAVIVAAAGNRPAGRPVYPAAYDSTLAVSALLPEGEVWRESNYGDFVSLAAPGFAYMPAGAAPAGTYAGTSVSSAFCANVVARYLARHPQSSPADVSAALKRCLTPAGARGRNDRVGYGRLDQQAVARLLQ